ncbi:periplasmic binding protein-like I [Chlamydoabsidia padenii]|nr:periplasmic binding protein-like I [Chlamydoabsidia padenii]
MSSTRNDAQSATNAESTKSSALNFTIPRAIDDETEDTTTRRIYHDKANNFTFTLTRKNGTAFISPLETNGRTELKIGVLLPFHQNDNEWTKMITLSGASAIRMAVAEINTKGLIPGAYITLIEQDSFPKEVQGQAAITQAVYSAVSLMHEGVIAVIGDITSSWTAISAIMTSTLQIPQCSFSAIATSLSDKAEYSYFFRTIPTDLIYTDAVLTFVANQGWPTIGILFSGDTFGKQLSKDIIMKARTYNINVKGYQLFLNRGQKGNVQKSIDTLMSTGARIIFVAAMDDALTTALVAAANKGHINKDTVWLTIGADTNELLQSVNKFNHALSLRTNNVQNSTNPDSIIRLAETTHNTTPINYNSTFSGGVFIFNSIVNLPGYAPFDQFLQKWASLDPTIYPYGGQRNISDWLILA